MSTDLTGPVATIDEHALIDGAVRWLNGAIQAS